MSGAAKPTAAQKGRSIDLDGAIRAKMEHAFGDLSAVKLYESQAVGDAGAEAIARGNEIAFAPGMADFSTRSGQERLGHELSHVMSQRSGAVRGAGFLANSALEARADREGAMAAAGEQVYTGPVTHAPAVAGPMQAKRSDDEPVQHHAPAHHHAPAQAPQAQILNPAQDLQAPAIGQAPVFHHNPLQDFQSPAVAPMPVIHRQPHRDFQSPAVSPMPVIHRDPIQDLQSPTVAPKLSPEENAAMLRSYQAKKNVERMYRIQAGLMTGLEDENLISQEDLDWYENMKQNADVDTVREINRRGDVSSRKLVEYRDSLEGDDMEKKNYEASWSKPALDFDIFNMMGTALGDSPGYDTYIQGLQEKYMQDPTYRAEDGRIQQEATKITEAHFTERKANEKRYRYARTKVSPEELDRRKAQRLDQFRQIALGGNKQNRKPAGKSQKPNPKPTNKSQNLIHDEDQPEFLIHDDSEPVNLLGSESDPENLFSNNNALIIFPDKKPAPRSKYAADYDLLSSQKGTPEERKDAYDHMAVDTMGNLTDPQKDSLRSYIKGSEPINSYLRNDRSNIEYPSDQKIPQVQEEIKNISEGLKNNPLQENLSAFKGITDKYLAMMFRQFGLKKALNKDGTLNHKWLRDNQNKMKKTLVGKTFHDKGYTSTTTEREFALGWARQKAKGEYLNLLEEQGRDEEVMQYENEVEGHPEKIKGAHMVRFNLPKGANASFIDRTFDKGNNRSRNDQREILVDKGGSFKISDIRKAEDADSYELVMDMLAEEEGKKKKNK